MYHKHESCFVHCNDEHDTDALFGELCLLAPESFGFSTRMPVGLKVKRRVLLINVDKYIHDLPVGDLLNQIISKNAWLDILLMFTKC